MSAPKKSDLKNKISHSSNKTKKGILKYVREKTRKSNTTNPTRCRRRSIRIPGVTGLNNLGSTCYMNCIVQCYSNTRLLHNFYINNVNYDGTEIDPKKMGQVSLELRSVLFDIWSGAENNVTPSKLSRVIRARSGQRYRRHDQHDAHEFMMSLNGWLHEDLLYYTEQMENHSEITSIIYKTFYGNHLNTFKCKTCKKVKYKKEIFSNIVLPIPRKGHSTLKACLREFYATEELADFYCDGCNLYKSATYEKSILHHPVVLVICLKRFQECYKRKSYEKLLTKIEYPIRNLKVHGTTYNLYGIITHRSRGSSLHSGHYFALVKNLLNSRWYKYDDHHVYEISESEIIRPADSYILFYQRVDVRHDEN